MSARHAAEIITVLWEPRRIGRSESFGLGLSGRATRSCWGGAAFGPFFSLPAPLRERFTPLYADSTHELSSSGRRHHPLELHKAAHVVDQVHEPDLRASACHADGAHELAAHGVLLIAKDVLDAGAHPCACGVGVLLALGEGMVAGSAAMDAALVALRLQLGLGLDRPVGAVGPHLVAGVGFVQNLIELLAVVHRGVGLGVAADQLVLAVD